MNWDQFRNDTSTIYEQARRRLDEQASEYMAPSSRPAVMDLGKAIECHGAADMQLKVIHAALDGKDPVFTFRKRKEPHT